MTRALQPPRTARSSPREDLEERIRHFIRRALVAPDIDSNQEEDEP